jgi:hypothetical protein
MISGMAVAQAATTPSKTSTATAANADLCHIHRIRFRLSAIDAECFFVAGTSALMLSDMASDITQVSDRVS